ncbi:hypothetical protein F4824DRAFT_496164 [Ustulina deusta]|nr:hypothetical protein F4824DRAFT_496164 [Ustulina deusta]
MVSGSQFPHVVWIFVFVMLVCTVPNVTVTPLPSSCTSFPGYDNGTGIATPLKVVADSTGKGIDGGSFVPKYATATDNNTTRRLRQSDSGSNALRQWLVAGVAEHRFNGLRWQTLVAAGTPAESVFGFGLPNLPDPNYELGPYIHEIDGVRQPGVYIGAVNVTTWGFNYQNSSETGEYYS